MANFTNCFMLLRCVILLLGVSTFATPNSCEAQCATCNPNSIPLKVHVYHYYLGYNGLPGVGGTDPLTLSFCNQSAVWTPDPYGRLVHGTWDATIPVVPNKQYLVQDNWQSVYDLASQTGFFGGADIGFFAPSSVDIYFDNQKLTSDGNGTDCQLHYYTLWCGPVEDDDGNELPGGPYFQLFGAADSSNGPHYLVVVPKAVNPLGSCDPQLNSVHLQLGLGTTSNGASAGSITLDQDSLTADSYKASSLNYYPAPGVETVPAIIAPGTTIRQIKAPQGFADIVPLGDGSSGFEIRYYSPSQIGVKNGAGLYTPTGSPLVTWRVQNPDASSNTYSRLDLTEIRDTRTTVNEYAYNASIGAWSLSKGGDSSGNFVRTETRTVATGSTSETNPDGSAVAQSVVTQTVTPYGSTTPVSSVSHYYNHYAWGDGEVRTEVGINNDVQVTTRVFDSTGLITQTTNPDGSYDLSGRGPFMDSPSSAATAQSQANVGWYHSDDGTFESINGQTVRQSYEVSSTYASNITYPPTSDSIDVLANAVNTDAVNALVTTTGTYSAQCASPWTSQPAYTQYPDGHQDTWTYEPGTFLTSSDGTFHYSLNGTALRTTLTHGTVASPTGIAGYSTQERSTYDEQGHLLMEEIFALPQGTSTFALVSTTTHNYDATGNLTASTRNGRAIYSATWTNNLETSETDDQGLVTSYSNFDGLGNALTVTKSGVGASGSYAAQPDIPSTLAYNADGKVLSQTIGVGVLQQVRSSTYNTAGLPTSQTAGGLTTTYAYANGGRTTTMTSPGGAAQITDHYLDGRDKNVSGNGVVAKAYIYGVVGADDSTTGDKAGYQWKVEYEGTSDPASPTARYTKTVTDWMGRTTRIEKPAFGGGTFNTGYIYDATTGQVTKMTQTGLADTLYTYDPFGNQRAVGLDMDGSGALEINSSTDRFTDTNAIYQQVGGNICLVTTATVYGDTPAVTTQTEQLTGLAGNTVSQVTISGPAGTKTSTTTIDRAAKLVTTTNSVPGATNPAVQVTYNGFLVCTKTPAVTAATIYIPDSLGRQSTAINPGTGATTTTIYDAATGQISSTGTTSADQSSSVLTICTYYGPSDTGIGQVPGQLKSRAINGVVTNYTYNTRNQVTGVTGNTYPLSYSYDDYGALQTLTTNSAGGNSVTTWVHDAATGLVTQKQDNSHVGPSYTYYPFGKVQARTWARGVVASYSYDGHGVLSGMSYSDGATPTVTITNNRLGQPAHITDAAGTHTLSYTNVGQLAGDSVSGSGVLAGTSVSVGFDGYLRRSTLSASGGSLAYSAGYSYDAASGILSGITDNTNGSTAGYTYQPSSTQLANTTFNHGGAVRLTTARVPDGLGRLSSITNTAGGSVVSSQGYVYNTHGQRSQATLADSSYWIYGYNTQGEVASGHHYWSGGTTLVAGQQFDYNFDGIGNRTSTTVNGRNATYTPNALNQYSSRDVLGTVDVLGVADPSATVTINNLPPDIRQQGGYFYKGLGVDNANGAVDKSVDVLAFKGGAGAGGADVVSESQGGVFVPQTPEQFSYDADGNLKQDGRWSYTWDGENRLIALTAVSSVPTTAKKQLKFAYDWMGRRIQKQVFDWNAASGTYNTVASSVTRFVYDGWSLVEELDASGTALRTYVWGQDLSGNLQDAGGIGGLLELNDYTDNNGAQTYYTGYDGNGNITELVNAGSGEVSAQYEYGIFGQELRLTGNSIAYKNPIKWCSKYTDDESGLVYYGYRIYNPYIGRWLSRDPLQEYGGTNIYAYVSNRPVSNVDPLGLCPFIAVSGSQVIGPANHATLSYFTGTASPTLNAKYTVSELIKQGAKIEASVELERSPAYGKRETQDWKVWREDYDSTPGYTTQSPNEPLWQIDRVGISYILYGKGYGTGNMAAVYVDTDIAKIKKKWDSMISTAQGYKWASQDINTPSNFPNSIYSDPSLLGTGNNSNTFARYVLDHAGLNSNLHSLLGGLFPGNNSPSDISNIWSGTPVPWNMPMPAHP